MMSFQFKMLDYNLVGYDSRQPKTQRGYFNYI